MWKYVTCCVRDTIQRSVNYFDARCGAGLVSNNQTCVVPRKDNPIKKYREQKCSGNFDGKETKNGFNWHQCHILNSWIKTFTCTSALVFGWYASQLLCIKYKHQQRFYKHIGIEKNCLDKFITRNSKTIHSAVLSHVVYAHPNDSKTFYPQNINNDEQYNAKVDEPKSFENSLDDAVRGLTCVLSSVENKLGLAAIEGGDIKNGVQMLKSAAERNHAPALYNLALCYQKGIGVKKNEKMAAELYQAAAALDHPAAMYNLAIFHGQGRGGLVRDPKAAEDLLHLAASKGQEDAIKILAKSVRVQANENISMNLNKNDSNIGKMNNAYNINKDPYAPMHLFLDIITSSDRASYKEVGVLSY